MKISVEAIQPEKQAKHCLVIGVYSNQALTGSAKAIDKQCGGYLTKLLKNGAFDAKAGETLPLYHLANGEFEHLLLVGCGEADKITPMVFRKIVTGAIKGLVSSKTAKAICYLSEVTVGKETLAFNVRQTTETAFEAIYRFEQFKSKKSDSIALKELIIHLSDESEKAACKKALNEGLAIAAGVAYTKDLGNMPSNICTPTYLAKEAEALAKAYPSIKVNVLEEKDMQKLGMGALLGVSQGSDEPAKLICLQYQGGNKKTAPIALIGKGVTFDTGGNSIKPADSMVGMKYDMCGAASVLGTMKALAELKLAVNVVGVIPAVENMPGGKAYKPEDILTSMSGKTIEVISTDAEGRLALCDAMTYAERYKPASVITIATLTGAVVIGLGFHATGLLSNHEPLAKSLLKAGLASNDRAWQLPLWEEYQEQIKSPFADMANTGGRTAGTITAGCFLSRFAENYHWAHLDVAGTAAMMMGTNERKATGRPVPMLVQYLIDHAT